MTKPRRPVEGFVVESLDGCGRSVSLAHFRRGSVNMAIHIRCRRCGRLSRRRRVPSVFSVLRWIGCRHDRPLTHRSWKLWSDYLNSMQECLIAFPSNPNVSGTQISFSIHHVRLYCQMGSVSPLWPAISHLTHWDGNWSYRSNIMADAEAAEKGGLFQTVVF